MLVASSLACREPTLDVSALECPDASELIEWGARRPKIYNVTCGNANIRVALGSEKTSLGAFSDRYDEDDLYCVKYIRYPDMKLLNTFLYSRMFVSRTETLTGQAYVKNMHDELDRIETDVRSYVTGNNHLSELSLVLSPTDVVGPVVFGTGVKCDEISSTKVNVIFVNKKYEPREFFEIITNRYGKENILISILNDSDMDQLKSL